MYHFQSNMCEKVNAMMNKMYSGCLELIIKFLKIFDKILQGGVTALKAM